MPDLLIAMGMFVNFSEAIIWAPDIEGIFDSSCNCSAHISMPSCSGFFASLKRAMMSLGIMATINQTITGETAELIAADFDITVEV